MDPEEEQECEKVMATVPEELRPLHMLAYMASKELEKEKQRKEKKRRGDEETNANGRNKKIKKSDKTERGKGISRKKSDGNNIRRNKVQLPAYNLLPNVPHHQELLETLRRMGGGEMVYLSGKPVTGTDLSKHQNRLLFRDGPTVERTLRGLIGDEETKKIMQKAGMKVRVVDRHGRVHGEDPLRQLILKRLECNGAFRLIGPGISRMLKSIGLQESVHYMHFFAFVVQREPRELMLAIVEEDLPQQEDAAEDEEEDEDAEPEDEEGGEQFKELKWGAKGRRSPVIWI